VTYREAKTLSKARQKIQWGEYTDGYQVEKDSIHQLERNAQVTIYRLHTGHCRLHQQLMKMVLHPTALCECGHSEQTPEDILQTCPNMSSRQHFWPGPTVLKTKLWGTVEDLRKTTNFRVPRIEGLISHDRTQKKKKNCHILAVPCSADDVATWGAMLTAWKRCREENLVRFTLTSLVLLSAFVVETLGITLLS
jgi:hypothetical protein